VALSTLVAVVVGIFIIPTAVGYWYGRNDRTPEELIEESKGEES
jgi:hypothetical protein